MLSSGLFFVAVYFYTHLRHVRLKQLRLGYFLALASVSMFIAILLVILFYHKATVSMYFNVVSIDLWLDEITVSIAVIIGVAFWFGILWRCAYWVFHRFFRR